MWFQNKLSSLAEVSLQYLPFLPLILDGCEQSPVSIGHFISRERAPITHWKWRVDAKASVDVLQMGKNLLSLPWFENQINQPIVLSLHKLHQPVSPGHTEEEYISCPCQEWNPGSPSQWPSHYTYNANPAPLGWWTDIYWMKCVQITHKNLRGNF
jgi:hypothetical protein